MEENKEQEKKTEKLSYDELKNKLSELDIQYQRLVGEYQRAMQALKVREFDYMSFFLQMLFKVIEHKGAYKPEFGKWAADNIMSIMTTFASSITPNENQNEEKKDEAQ